MLPELLPELTDKTGRDLTGFKMESAKGTGSDRKVAKAAIRGTLGPRRPGAGRFPLLTRFPARLANELRHDSVGTGY